MSEQQMRDEKIAGFYAELIGWGEMDVITAIEWIEAAGIVLGDFADYTNQFCHDVGMDLKDIDISALALEYIATEAGCEEIAGNVSCNFYCSEYDCTPDVARRDLEAVREDERGAAWEFVRDHTIGGEDVDSH